MDSKKHGANKSLPPLNPILARSTYAAIITLLSIAAPFINGGIGEFIAEILANEEGIGIQVENAVLAINTLVGTASLVWLWFERRAPNYRLSFKTSR